MLFTIEFQCKNPSMKSAQTLANIHLCSLSYDVPSLIKSELFGLVNIRLLSPAGEVFDSGSVSESGSID